MTEPAPEVTAGLAAVRSWCGWHVAPSMSETVEVEGQASRVLLLPSLYVTGITEVRNEAGSVVSDFKWRKNGIVRGCWSWQDLYSLDITHGYDVMPPELQAVVDSLDAAGVGAGSVTAQSAGPFSQTFGTNLESQPVTTRAIIGRYRLPSRP